MLKTVARHSTPVVVGMDALEPRQLLSGVAWSQQALQIGQDLAVQNYPTITGAGETIAIIDTGVDYHHPVLGGGIGHGLKVVDGYDFMTNSTDPAPKDGIIPHGTASAGLAAGYGWNFDNHYFQGIAPGAQIVALRAYGPTIATALDWVISHRQQYNIVAVQVLGPDTTDQAEINTLVKAGVFIGTSGGNGGATKPIPKLAGVVRTGSVDPLNQLSWFTQRGARLSMVAPGETVAIPWELQDGEQVELYSYGTSWASPQVVGAAALIKQINPKFNEVQILSILQDSGTKIFDPTSNRTYAELNVNSAISLAISRSQPSIPVTGSPHKSRSGKTLAARGGAHSHKSKSGKTIAQRTATQAAAARSVTPAAARPTFSLTEITLDGSARKDDVLA